MKDPLYQIAKELKLNYTKDNWLDLKSTSKNTVLQVLHDQGFDKIKGKRDWSDGDSTIRYMMATGWLRNI